MSISIHVEKPTEHWAGKELKRLGIRCGRTVKRLIRTVTVLSEQVGKSLAAASANAVEAKAMYRLLDHEALTETVMLEAHRKATIEHMKTDGSTTILAVQDATTLNYSTHPATEGLGDFGGTPKDRGLIVHSSLALTPAGVTLGLLDQMIWSRSLKQRGKRVDRAQKPIEEKESYKWLESMDHSRAEIPATIRLVHVADREADVYEFFDHALGKQQDFLIRVVQNRLTAETLKLMDWIREEPSRGEVVVKIPRDTRRHLPERETTLQVRYGQIEIKAPANMPATWRKSPSVGLSIVYVQESTPASGVAPIEWYLLTSIEVTNVEEAVEKVTWYMHRWKIERFHYILKSGCEIEKLQHRKVERLQKLIFIYSMISARILGMTYLARQSPEASCAHYLEEEEWRVLYCITHKTSIAPSKAPTMREAIAGLAKLGGFLGRKTDGEPGVQVIWKGFNELHTVLRHYRFLSP